MIPSKIQSQHNLTKMSSTKTSVSHVGEAAQGMYIPVVFNVFNRDNKGKFECECKFGHEDSSKNPKNTPQLITTEKNNNKKEAKKLAADKMLSKIQQHYGDWRQIKRQCQTEMEKNRAETRQKSNSLHDNIRQAKYDEMNIDAFIAPPGYPGHRIVFVFKDKDGNQITSIDSSESERKKPLGAKEKSLRRVQGSKTRNAPRRNARK